MDVVIREAEPETDWLTGIWPIFEEVVHAGDTFAFAPNTTEPTAREQWMLPAPARVFVAINKSDDAILGSAYVKPNQPGLGGHVASAAFMVAAAVSGRGVGRALAEHAIAWARQANFSAMQFNFALWKNLGFSIIGTIPEAFQHQGLGRKVDAFCDAPLSLICPTLRFGDGA